MKIASSMMVSNVYNYTKSQNAAKFSLGINDPVSKPKGMDTVSISAAAQQKKTPIMLEIPSEFEFDEYIPFKIEKIPAEFQNLEIKSIFDNDDVSQDVKDFLKDKNATAFRYQRLYEDDPKKANVFLESVKAGHFISYIDLDEKFAGQSYEDVLKHVNDLLIEDHITSRREFKDCISGNGSNGGNSTYQFLFSSDDNYGQYYRGKRAMLGDDGVTILGFEYLLMNEDKWGTLEETGYQSKYPPIFNPIGVGLTEKIYFDIEDFLADAPENAKVNMFNGNYDVDRFKPKW